MDRAYIPIPEYHSLLDFWSIILVIIWAIAYGAILEEKWITENKALCGMILGIVLLIGIIARLIKYIIQKRYQ